MTLVRISPTIRLPARPPMPFAYRCFPVQCSANYTKDTNFEQEVLNAPYKGLSYLVR
jgi:hypothetical protein